MNCSLCYRPIVGNDYAAVSFFATFNRDLRLDGPLHHGCLYDCINYLIRGDYYEPLQPPR